MSSAMEIEPDHTAQDVDYIWFSKRQIVKYIIDVDEKRERTAIRYKGQQIDEKQCMLILLLRMDELSILKICI